MEVVEVETVEVEVEAAEVVEAFEVPGVVNCTVLSGTTGEEALPTTEVELLGLVGLFDVSYQKVNELVIRTAHSAHLLRQSCFRLVVQLLEICQYT